MRIHDKSYPHPVLASFRDDISPNRFDLTATISADAEYFYISYEFDYENSTIESLLLAGQATHSLHVECKRNYFRELYRSSLRKAELKIPAAEVLGRIELCGFVQAETEIDGYKAAGAHSDYGETSFALLPGDVLAVSETLVVDAYNDYDRLATLSSIMDIERAKDEHQVRLQVSLDQDRIIATLPQRDFDRYSELKADPQIAPVVANQILVPVILESLYYITHFDDGEMEDAMDKKWVRSIVAKLNDENFDIFNKASSELDALQILLQLPLHRALTMIGDALADSEDAK